MLLGVFKLPCKYASANLYKILTDEMPSSMSKILHSQLTMLPEYPYFFPFVITKKTQQRFMYIQKGNVKKKRWIFYRKESMPNLFSVAN